MSDNKFNQKEGEDQEAGCIINVASVAAFDGQQGQCAYSATKAALVGIIIPDNYDIPDVGSLPDAGIGEFRLS
jgi:hypothetical protein